jgi:6-phosphogluconolactonase
MPRRLITLLSTIVLAAITAAPLVAADAPVVPPKTGTREVLELFNGKDLAGWKGHEKYWSVKDGVIVGKNTDPIAVSTYLLTERSFSDFRLVCDFKLAESEMHSGIAIWGRIAPERGDPFTYGGHLVMFPSGYGFYDLYGRNSIHKNADTARKVGKQHDWNHLEILAQGNRIRFALNGVLISDWREPEPDRIKEAPIGLQLHSNKVPQEVQFKNLTLETFPDDKLISLVTPANATSTLDKVRMYVGTYTGKLSKGIYRVDLDLKSGKFSPATLAAESNNPSFLTLHPSGKYAFAVNEIGSFEGKKSGAVTAFAIDEATGDLKQLNQQSSVGTGPCHITCDTAGKHVVVANYGGGSTAVLPIQADGKLGESSSFVQHAGSSVNSKRQESPHAHSANLDAWNRFAFVADLGLDKVLVYRYDSAKGTIAPNEPPAGVVAPGSGPRHFAFHPSGRFAFVINELKSTVTAFAYDKQTGTLAELQTLSTLPGDYQGGNSTAEVVCHPSGQFLYGSNRGHNSIAAYRIDQSTGKLTLVGIQGQGIAVPRNFNIDPTGQFAVVANQGGDSLLLFRVDAKTGALLPTGEKVEVGAPVCVKFLLQ